MRLKSLISCLLSGAQAFWVDENGLFGLDDLLVGGIAGGLIGGIGGLFGKSSTSTVNVQAPGEAENKASWAESRNLMELEDLTNAGPGRQDVERSLQSQRGLAAMLQQYAQSGGMPSADDINSTNNVAASLFQARRTALNQNFQDQNTASNQLAARLGRTADDPILRARLLTNQSRMLSSLDAEQSGFGTQLALGLADRRVGFAQGAAGVDAALAAQAQQNRAALLGLGQQVANRHTQFRLATAGRTTEQPGGIGQAIGGALGGAGMGMMLGGAFGNAFGASGLATAPIAAGGWGAPSSYVRSLA